MERQWCAKWVQMCVTVNHYKVTGIFKCSRGEGERDGTGLIEQILCPALLIRLISQQPGVNYHTHTSCCCSTYIIITVAKIENNVKPAIWGPTLPTSHAHICINIQSHINIFRLSLSLCHQIQAPPGPPTSPPPPRASCFFFLLDRFHLFNDGATNDPSHVADGETGTRWKWGLRGDQGGRSGCHWGGQTEIVGAQQMTPRRMSGAADTRHAGSLCLSQTNKDTGCREEINKLSSEWL